MKEFFKPWVLAILLVFLKFHLGFSHMLWIEEEKGEFKIFWGHKGKVEPYNPERIKEIKVFDERERSLKFNKKTEDKALVLLVNRKPSIIIASMEEVYLVNTSEGRKRMNKIEAQKQGLQVTESFIVIQATKGIFSDTPILKKPLGIRLEPLFMDNPFEKRDLIEVKILYEGKPVEGVSVLNAFHKELAKTDSQGMVKLKVEDLKLKEGYYTLVTSYKVKISDPKADYIWLITSLTWQK